MSLPHCPFERVILSTAFVCRTSQRQYVAEKEAVACTAPFARQRCKQLVKQFRQCAKFALPELRNGDQLPHGQEMKLKTGGLKGVQELLQLDTRLPADIRDCVDALADRYLEIESAPCQPIVRAIQTYQGRRGARPK